MGQVVKLSTDSPLLTAIRRKFPEYHPVVAMVELAHHADAQDDLRLQFEIHKAVAPYIAPRLASLEVTPPREPSRVVVSLFEDVALPDGRTVQAEVPLVRLIEDQDEIVPLD